jgi:hypothetical protein
MNDSERSMVYTEHTSTHRFTDANSSGQTNEIQHPIQR